MSWAELPQSVFFPKLSTFALTGVLLSVALATVAALFRDRADRTLRAVDGVQAAGMRVLARIPHVAWVGRNGNRLEKRMDRPSSLQESIRGLYAECLLVKSKRYDLDTPIRSIMVASSDSGEGKSFITLALAHFAAAAGRRVLVLECDLRQPSMGRTLGLPFGPGLSEVCGARSRQSRRCARRAWVAWTSSSQAGRRSTRPSCSAAPGCARSWHGRAPATT